MFLPLNLVVLCPQTHVLAHHLQVVHVRSACGGASPAMAPSSGYNLFGGEAMLESPGLLDFIISMVQLDFSSAHWLPEKSGDCEVPLPK